MKTIRVETSLHQREANMVGEPFQKKNHIIKKSESYMVFTRGGLSSHGYIGWGRTGNRLKDK
tara:strand:- start:1805 stop:1990 length:186 start_codon:yes stop_codon:yes gene_type:complete